MKIYIIGQSDINKKMSSVSKLRSEENIVLNPSDQRIIADRDINYYVNKMSKEMLKADAIYVIDDNDDISKELIKIATENNLFKLSYK